jgi:hypothetical protein
VEARLIDFLNIKTSCNKIFKLVWAFLVDPLELLDDYVNVGTLDINWIDSKIGHASEFPESLIWI